MSLNFDAMCSGTFVHTNHARRSTYN